MINEYRDTNINRQTKINSLAGIKAIAMLLLFWWHSSMPKPSCDLGARTCEILFIASGFLVGYNYFYKNVSASWKESLRYASSKLIRFWPLHVCVTIIVMLKTARPLFSINNFLTAILNISLLQAWSPSQNVYFSFNGVSWFLSALIFCYFMSPVLLKLSKRVKVSTTLFFIVFAIRYIIEHVNNVYPNQFCSFNIHVSPFVRCLEFFMGMLLVPLFMYVREQIKNKKLFALSSIMEVLIVLLVIYLVITKNMWYRATFVLLFSIIVFIFGYDKGILSRILSTKPFKWFSTIQFEFYILHAAVITCIGGLYGRLMPDWRIMNIVLFITIILCALVYNKFLSNFFSNLARKIFNNIFHLLKIDIIL